MMLAQSKIFRQGLGGKDILIFDDLFEPKFVSSLYRTLNDAEYDTPPDDHVYRSWVCPFDPEDFARHELFLRASEALVAEYPQVRPTCLSARASVQTFGDFVPLQTTTEDESVRTVLYYANDEWEREWAAETILFSSNDQPAMALSHQPGRIAVLPAEQEYRFGVPSRQTHLTSVTVQFQVQLR